MEIRITKTALADIQPLRELFLKENQFQIRYDSCHTRGWSDSYLIFDANEPIGYGSVKGKEDLAHRDTVFEFYLLPPFRNTCGDIFQKLAIISKAKYVETQSNEFLLTSMLFEYTENIYSDVILFEDASETTFELPDLTFRKKNPENDRHWNRNSELGQFVLDKAGEIVGTGGFLTHYNFPFADLYMEVKQEFRGKGFGSYILQELKKECYKSGRIPAARCNISNPASKATLLKSGMKVCGYMLSGKIKAR